MAKDVKEEKRKRSDECSKESSFYHNKVGMAARWHEDCAGNMKFTGIDLVSNPANDIAYFEHTVIKRNYSNRKANMFGMGSIKNKVDKKEESKLPEITIDTTDFLRKLRYDEMKFISKTLNVRVLSFYDIVFNPTNTQYQFNIFDNGEDRTLCIWSEYYAHDQIYDDSSRNSYELIIQNLYMLLIADVKESSKEVIETLIFTICMSMSMVNDTFKILNEVFFRAIEKKLSDIKIELLNNK